MYVQYYSYYCFGFEFLFLFRFSFLFLILFSFSSFPEWDSPVSLLLLFSVLHLLIIILINIVIGGHMLRQELGKLIQVLQ